MEKAKENNRLTDKQRLFCLYYVKYFNATKAYQKAYECGYNTARVEGSKALANPNIKNEIKKLKEPIIESLSVSANDVFQKYIDIAFADITDYIEFGTEIFTYVDDLGETKEEKRNYIRLKNSNVVDGSIVSEIKVGKDGVTVKLNDRIKALQWLTDHMDLETEDQKAKIAILKQKLGNNGENRTVVIFGENEIEDDGFIEALKNSAKEDWKSERYGGEIFDE